MEKVPMTPGGFAALEAELKDRQQVQRQRIIEAISEARALGDLSENAEYHAAKEAQSLNEGRIQELESLIGRADIIDVSKLAGSDTSWLRDKSNSCSAPRPPKLSGSDASWLPEYG